MDKIEMLKHVSSANKKAADDLLKVISNTNPCPFVRAIYYEDRDCVQFDRPSGLTWFISAYSSRRNRINERYNFRFNGEGYSYKINESHTIVYVYHGLRMYSIPLEVN